MYNPQLDTFVTVAERGSFTKAAEELYITPTAVIKQMNLLESKLGLTLFERTHRGLKLTAAGHSLLSDAKYMISYANEAVVRAREAAEKSASVVRIGTSPMTPAQILVELWPKLHERLPNVKFRLVPFENTPENAREILKNLGRDIDVVAGFCDETMLEYRRCCGLELFRAPICCAVSLSHPLASKERLAVSDLFGENLMLIRRGRNRCANGGALLTAVECWCSVHPLLRIIPVEWEHAIPYGLLHAREPSPLVRGCIEAVRGVFSAGGAL